MIKALILDVDGVIVGDKTGHNFPLPHTEVIQAFRELHSKGVPIVLCTAKFGFAIQEIVKQAALDNPHIADGGALIIDPLDNRIIKKHVIDKKIVKTCVERCLQEKISVELYTPDAYYIQKGLYPELIPQRIKVLQKAPVVVDDLQAIADEQDIIKTLAFASDNDMPKVEKMIADLADQVTFIQTIHPFLLPLKIGVITAPGVSKAHASQEVAEHLGIGMEEILGVGDTKGDWRFMELCGYAATLANGDERIKQLVRSKGEGKYFIAPHVNDNGMLDIIRHFSFGT